MQMEKAPSLRRKALHAGAVLGITAATVLATATPSWAAEETASISPATGKTGGGDNLFMTFTLPASDAANNFIQGTTAVVFVAAATCPATYGSPTANLTVAPSAVRVINAGRLAVNVPAGVTAGAGISAGNKYNVCAYNGTSSGTVLSAKAEAAGGVYTVGAVPVVDSYTPTAAGTQGGQTFTITGSNLLNATVTIGGVDAGGTGTANSYTGTVPAHAAGGPFPIVVTNPIGGSYTIARGFTYANGLVAQPNTAPNTKMRTDVYITGSGFGGINFTGTNGQTPNDGNGHVYLVRGTYDPTKSGLGKANGQVTECVNVLRITDADLVCTLFLAGGGIPQVSTRVVSGTVAGTTLTSATGNFGPGDVGMALSGPVALGTGVYITSITDSTRAVLNKAPTSAITTAQNITLTPNRTIASADLTLTNGQTGVTAANGVTFSSADIGRAISGSGIPEGTVIQAAPTSTTATLSNAATGTSSGSYTIGSSPMTPVPNGTYTLTVVSNGAIDAQPGGTNADASFTKTVINSGSTFTVAEY